MTSTAPGRLVYNVTEDWYFASHRLPIAAAALRAGYDVHVVTRLSSKESLLTEMGFTVHNLKIQRAGLNPLADLGYLRNLTSLYKEIQPTIVHHVAMKPVLYGSVAARLAGVPIVINALAGLGFVFSSSSATARSLRRVIAPALRRALNASSSHAIVQNEDDALILRTLGVKETRMSVIRGSGVDIDTFSPPAASEHEVGAHPVVALCARLNAEKGVRDFYRAAAQLRAEGSPARFVLVGRPDTANPSRIPEAEIHGWVASGDIEWWGWTDDMANTLRKVDIACLPSTYGEGLPKSLLEAASCGLPVVTTDSPGCRDAVERGVTGYAVTPREPQLLAAALRDLIMNPSRRHDMGMAGRARVIELFSEDVVVSATMALYASRAARGMTGK